MICAPSTSNSLPPKLRTRTESGCQRLLTVGKRARGGVLERCEGIVRLEALGERLCALRTDTVLLETASEWHSECQRLLTVEKRACGGALELLERRVGLEGLREVLCALSTDVVVPETASDGEIRVSAAADSRETGVWRRT